MPQITPTQNMLLSSIKDDSLRYRIEQFVQDHDLSTNTIEDLCRLANDFNARLTKAYNQGYNDGADDYDDDDDWD